MESLHRIREFAVGGRRTGAEFLRVAVLVVVPGGVARDLRLEPDVVVPHHSVAIRLETEAAVVECAQDEHLAPAGSDLPELQLRLEHSLSALHRAHHVRASLLRRYPCRDHAVAALRLGDGQIHRRPRIRLQGSKALRTDGLQCRAVPFKTNLRETDAPRPPSRRCEPETDEVARAGLRLQLPVGALGG